MNEKNFLSGLFQCSESDNENNSDSDDGINSGEVSNETTQVNSDGNWENIFVQCRFLQNVQLDIVQKKQLGIAFQLWPAATLLIDFLVQNPELLQNGTKQLNILELGAGLGVTGMFLAKCSCFIGFEEIGKVLLTDIGDAVPTINENIIRNGLDGTEACELDWNKPESVAAACSKFPQFAEYPPIVIASDVVYWECLFLPLVVVLSELCRKGCIVYMSHVRRWKKDQKFFQLCRKHALSVTTLSEVVEFVPHEHTNEPQKQISRVYKIVEEKRSR